MASDNAAEESDRRTDHCHEEVLDKIENADGSITDANSFHDTNLTEFLGKGKRNGKVEYNKGNEDQAYTHRKQNAGNNHVQHICHFDHSTVTVECNTLCIGECICHGGNIRGIHIPDPAEKALLNAAEFCKILFIHQKADIAHQIRTKHSILTGTGNCQGEVHTWRVCLR